MTIKPDFTVLVDSQKVSFGVTISHSSYKMAQVYHPKIAQFYFPIGTKDETIKSRIIKLLKSVSE